MATAGTGRRAGGANQVASSVTDEHAVDLHQTSSSAPAGSTSVAATDAGALSLYRSEHVGRRRDVVTSEVAANLSCGFSGRSVDAVSERRRGRHHAEAAFFEIMSFPMRME